MHFALRQSCETSTVNLMASSIPPTRPSVKVSNAQDFRVQRGLIREAERVLLEEGSQLDEAQIAALSDIDSSLVVTLASLVHQVRLKWTGPTVELRGNRFCEDGRMPGRLSPLLAIVTF